MAIANQEGKRQKEKGKGQSFKEGVLSFAFFLFTFTFR
jgi:hypothetical protein